jgi:predicted RNA-binding protein with PUA-like domain
LPNCETKQIKSRTGFTNILSAEDIRHADSTGKMRGGQTGWNPVLRYAMKSFWLVKQEPSSYSWSDFLADGETSWTGVRNFSARNNLRKMRTGDEVLFYHTGDEKSVVGIAKVRRTAYPDPTAKEGDWSTVDLAAVKPLRRPVTLREIKSNSRLKEIPLIRQSRLSVMPLSEPEFREIVKTGDQGGTAS